MGAPQNIENSQILYNDSNIIAMDKSSGDVVIPARGEAATLSLKSRLEQLLGERLFTVHRIDRGTSGIVLFAKNEKAHTQFCRMFETRLIKKEYLAFVEGTINDGFICSKPIKEFGSGRMGVHAGGKQSETRFEVVEKYRNCTLIRAFPLTGRRHQIRVHLYSSGFPILGDPLYGKNRPVGGFERLMLHANKLTFKYPQETEVTITAPVDKVWQEKMTLLRKYCL